MAGADAQVQRELTKEEALGAAAARRCCALALSASRRVAAGARAD
jgi:hypothetical protein